jgi:hypothetical protein
LIVLQILLRLIFALVLFKICSTMTTLNSLILALENQYYSAATSFINADPSLLEQRTEDNQTVLDYFCSRYNPAVAEWLCQKLTSRGLSVDFYDEEERATIQNSYLNNNAEIVKILLKYTEVPHLREWLVQRQLIAILGINFLTQNSIKVNPIQAKSAEGGYIIESAHVMSSAITSLTEINDHYAGIDKSIINFYDNLRDSNQPTMLLDKLIDQVNQPGNPRVLFSAGCIQHVFVVAIQKQKTGTYQFTFYDNFTKEDSYDFATYAGRLITGETPIVRRINVPEENLAELILTLLITKQQRMAEVYQWLDALPEQLGNPYQFDQNILMDTYNNESNRCYWKNSCYAVMDLFIDKFGVKQGIQEFNHFLQVIDLKLVENFKEAFKEHYDEQAINRLEKAVGTTTFVQSPAFYTAKLFFSVLTSIAAAVATICCCYAAFGVPAFAGLAALLGPVGLIVAPIVCTLLIFHEVVLPRLAGILSYTANLIWNTTSPLIIEPKASRKTHHSSSSMINYRLGETDAGLRLAHQATTQSTLKTPFVVSKQHQFGFTNKPAKQALTIQEDMGNLWSLSKSVR